MKKILSILLCAALLFALTSPAFALERADGLHFRADGTFKILHLTDTQDDHHPCADMLALVKSAIETEQPDLIVFTGDLVEDWRAVDGLTDDDPLHEGVCVYKDLSRKELDLTATRANVEAASDAVLSMLQASGIPFAITQGNNDYKAGYSNEDWLQLYSRYSNNLTFDESDDALGSIDYHLEIKGSSGATVFNLWMMDTGRSGIDAQSIAWYQSAAAAQTQANGGTPIPAMAFQHIEPQDIGNLFVPCSPFDDGARCTGGKFYRLDSDRAFGTPFYAWEPCEPSAEFQAWKAQGDVIAAWFGHEHVEGFSGNVDGIDLGFTYGCDYAKAGPYGYRVITLREEDPACYSSALVGISDGLRGSLLEFMLDSSPLFPRVTTGLRMLSAMRNFMISMFSAVVSLF
ncbi:MAG: metallophosphoesterase [Clostridia bacterium]|nr:metallophosphoesterase [Clostridia bacterium]